MILNIQVLKLHSGNMRIMKKVEKLIKMHKEWSFTEYQGFINKIKKIGDKPIREVKNMKRILKKRN